MREKVRASLSRPETMVLVIVATLMIALALVLVVGVAATRSKMPSATVADEAAPRVERLLSYTPETIESDLDVEQVYLTDDYREQYADLVRNTLEPQSIRDDVSVDAEVTRTAIVDATSQTLVVLIIAKLTTTQAGVSGEASDGRFRVTLQLEEGDWLISGLDVI